MITLKKASETPKTFTTNQLPLVLRILGRDEKATFEKIGRLGIIRYNNANKEPCFCGFYGGRKKPMYFYRFKNNEQRKAFIDPKIENEKKYLAEFKVKKESFALPKVGTIFYSSWGYGQTNINFYQVVKVRGKMTVDYRGIGCTVINDGNMTGRKSPIKGKFISGVSSARMSSTYNGFRINDCEYASLATRESYGFSSYH